MTRKLGIALISLLFVFGADAKTWKSETFELDSAGVSLIELEHAVGELEIVGTSSEKIEIRMKVECSSWRDRCEEKIRDIALEAERDGSTLEIEIDGFPKSVNSLSVDLEISMPARLSLDVDRGVGETRIRGIEGDVLVEAGVGEVRLAMPAGVVGRVTAECGVGQADLDIPDGRVERDGFLFLGNELRWSGEGTSRVDVELGVGSVEIDLE